jgi:hypothetical protein
METLNRIERKTLEEIVSHAIDGIQDRRESGIYGCDLHNALFNEDYYIIGYYQAEQWLIANGGVFNAIGEIQEYEKDNFGEITTDCSSSEKVVNMYVYILGEIVLNESNHLREVWDNRLNETDCECIIEDLKGLIK